MSHRNDPETIRRLLTTPGRWAVVGLSENPRRVAPRIAAMLRDHLGMRILPVNPRGEAALGEPGHRTLADAVQAGGPVDVVDCFVNSTKVGAVVDQAIAVGAGAVWLQLGVVDEDAAARAAAAGLDVVMDTCPAIEAPRFGL
ncbi:CoA-binding protein [Tersicoccus sp. MR15.9]|uniref:CoA-binding protein n=1 Tax=Tersicoccus mangrovi TaxID=3121635 RepID=UPI002FE63161